MEIELGILNFIQSIRTPFGDAVMPLITSLGNSGIIWIVLACVLTAVPRTRRSGIVLAAALVWDVVLCNGILKNLFARIRPCDINTSIQLLIDRPRDFSFPSGHTAAAFAAVSALYFAKESRLWKTAFLLSCVIAFSRLYLYVHYPTDILGGVAVGIAAGYAGYKTVELLRRRAEKENKFMHF